MTFEQGWSQREIETPPPQFPKALALAACKTSRLEALKDATGILCSVCYTLGDPPEMPQEGLPYHVCPDDPQGRVNSYPCYAGPIWKLIQQENPDPSKKAGSAPQSHDPSQGGLTGQGG